MQAIQNLSRNGFLSARNFGPFESSAPPEIAAPLLPAQQQNVCR